MQYVVNEMGIKKSAELEAAHCEIERQKASIDYIAMMSDVELIDSEEATQ